MAINFKNDLGDWNNDGVEPSDSLRENGFVGGYKPPASVFNWFWSNVIKCFDEVKSAVKSLESNLNGHTHTLTNSDIKGTLPVSKGGTGSITASGARSNLGLGSVAVKNVSSSIANGDTNIPTSGVVYSALSAKSNTGHTHTFTDITGAEIKIINDSVSSEGYFYIANWRYTTFDRLCMGYVIKSTNENVALLEYRSTEGKLNSLVDLYSKGVIVLTKDDITSTIANGNVSAVTSGAVYTALLNKAETTHSHALNDSTITGTLPVSKGGTGATSVASARTNLGLGSAATKGYTESVLSGNNSLVTSGAVYTALKSAGKQTHVVVATYDTQNPLKANADYTCTSSNASSILKTAINSVAKGGKVELLDGTYSLQYSADVLEIPTNVTIEGSGVSTVLKQGADADSGEAKTIFKIVGRDVAIKNMMICDENVNSAVEMIRQEEQGALYSGVFFIFNASDSSASGACIRGGADSDCRYSRIQDCRVYKGFNNAKKPMFDFSACTNFGGIIGANISSGYGNISVMFASTSHRDNTTIYGQTTDVMIDS